MELDIKHKRKSLATLHGRLKGTERTTYLSLLPLVLIVVFCLAHSNLTYLVGYIAAGVILPYLFYMLKLWNAKTTKDFNYVNNILDRKSTRLNSSHVRISYAVFCLKKKKKK